MRELNDAEMYMVSGGQKQGAKSSAAGTHGARPSRGRAEWQGFGSMTTPNWGDVAWSGIKGGAAGFVTGNYVGAAIGAGLGMLDAITHGTHEKGGSQGGGGHHGNHGGGPGG